MLIHKPWTIQPPSDVGVRASLGATLVWVGSAFGRTLVTPSRTTATNTTLVQTERGAAARITNGTSSGLLVASDRQSVIFNNQPCTIAVLRRSRDTTNRTTTLFGWTAASSERVMAHAPYSDGTLYWDCANSTSGSGRLSVSFTKSLNWETLVFYSGARGSEVWRNGIRIASSTTTTAPVVGNTANVPLYIGASSSATLTAGDNDDVALFVVSSGKDWTAGEIINWSRDPYGSTFEPRLFVVPAVVASSYTHPTLSAVTATEITATSFKPRVTYTF